MKSFRHCDFPGPLLPKIWQWNCHSSVANPIEEAYKFSNNHPKGQNPADILKYTQYVLQGTAYKGQLWQLVEFGKKLRDRLVFFPKIKGQDTIYQGTKD